MSGKPEALITSFLRHLTHERCLSRHTSTSYARDLRVLLKQLDNITLEQAQSPHIPGQSGLNCLDFSVYILISRL